MYDITLHCIIVQAATELKGKPVVVAKVCVRVCLQDVLSLYGVLWLV